jgi:hypothetical protein
VLPGCDVGGRVLGMGEPSLEGARWALNPVEGKRRWPPL